MTGGGADDSVGVSRSSSRSSWTCSSACWGLGDAKASPVLLFRSNVLLLSAPLPPSAVCRGDDGGSGGGLGAKVN